MNHDVEELVTHNLYAFDDDEKKKEHVVKRVINVKMYIKGKKLPVNTLSNPFDNVFFSF